jgi:sugar transferase (PEP-CTERM system associated)
MKLKFKKLMLGDLLFAGMSFYLALIIRFGYQGAYVELDSKPLLRPIIFVAVLVTVSYIYDLYSLSKQRGPRQLLKQVLQSVFVSFLALSVIIFLIPDWMLGRGLLAISLGLFICFQFTWHTLFRIIFNLPYLAEQIIVLGSCQAAVRIGEIIQSADDVNHTLAGYVACSECRADEAGAPEGMVIGGVQQLLEIVTHTKATMLIVTNPQHFVDSAYQNLLLNCKLLGVDILDVPTYFENVSGKLLLEDMDLNNLIYSTGFRHNTLVFAVKRVVDVVLSITGILLMLPFLPIILLLVKLNAPGPLLYRQVRVGHMGRNFSLYKFRTMPIDAENATGAVWAQLNDPRIGPIGRFLRKSRLDELPQLINVLLGSMSFVGPRPERPEFVTKLQELIPFYSKRHFIKPGITGWAQIRHPYGASTEESFEKLRYDLYYFKNLNPVLDTVIFLKTIKVVLSQFGGR